MTYPYIYVNSFGKWCVRADENTAYEDMLLGAAADLLMAIQHELEVEELRRQYSLPHIWRNMARFDVCS